MAASFSSSDDFVSEINVTPFVDVMLVLLIIFMVTAPMMTEGLNVDLPQVKTAEVLPTESDHMILTVKIDGSLLLDEYPTDTASLASLLKSAVVAPQKQLFLRADKQVPYGVVMEVMSQIRSAGVDKLGMVAESGGVSELAPNGTPAPTATPDSASSLGKSQAAAALQRAGL